MATEQREPFAEWAVLELMGHRRLGGFVREEEIAGCGMLRIDIPCAPPVTQFYAPAALYCLTPTTEEIARALAEMFKPEPVHRYELPTVSTTTARASQWENHPDNWVKDGDDDEPIF